MGRAAWGAALVVIACGAEQSNPVDDRDASGVASVRDDAGQVEDASILNVDSGDVELGLYTSPRELGD